jgi:hypothetical protein
MIKIIHYSFRFLLLIFLGHHFFLEATPIREQPNKHLYLLLSLQRQIDIYTPFSENNLQGTHNSYNTDPYHTLFRYHDRQQHLTIAEQLQHGARFIELDAHWTFSVWSMKQDLLLCHGSSKFNFFPFHWGCSPFDKPLDESLAEVSVWLSQEENKNEVLIFYIEDHTEGQHEYLYELLVKHKIAETMLESGGCNRIPDNLTKNDLLEKGKKIVFWKDEECSSYPALANLAFSDLGNLDRYAEDRTFIGTIEKQYIRGLNSRIENPDVIESFAKGGNIVNLDQFTINDERLFAVLWSFEYQESDVSQIEIKDGCALQKNNSFWKVEDCETKKRQAACYNQELNQWQLSEQELYWQEADSACRKVAGFVFSAPTNYLENMALKKLHSNDEMSVWLNVQKQKQKIVLGDKRQHN